MREKWFTGTYNDKWHSAARHFENQQPQAWRVKCFIICLVMAPYTHPFRFLIWEPLNAPLITAQEDFDGTSFWILAMMSCYLQTNESHSYNSIVTQPISFQVLKWITWSRKLLGGAVDCYFLLFGGVDTWWRRSLPSFWMLESAWRRKKTAAKTRAVNSWRIEG